MQLMIDRDANVVTINGSHRLVDCSSIDPNITHVRWFDDHGELHYRNGRTTGLADITRFKSIIDGWDAAGKTQTR